MKVELYEVLSVLGLLYVLYSEIRYIVLIKQMDKSIDLVYKTIDMVSKFGSRPEEPVYYYDDELGE